MKVIVLGFAVLSSMAVHGQSNDVQGLKGCWQLDEVVTTKLDGETTRRKLEYVCRDWITAEKITSACRDRLGLVRNVVERPYESPAPDKLLLKGYRQPEEIGFERERLRRTTSDPTMKPTERMPNPDVKRDSYYTRVSSDADGCLPKAERVGAKDAWAIWKGAELTQGFRRSQTELEFSMRLRDRDEIRIPADGLGQADRTKAIEEFWKVFDRTSVTGMADWEKQLSALEKIWSEKKVCSEHNQTMYLAAPELKQLAADIARETIALQRVASRFNAALWLFPEEVKGLLSISTAISKDAEERLKRSVIAEQLLLPRVVVVALAERPELAKEFDTATDFVALRDLGKKNAESFDKYGLQFTDFLRCPGQLMGSLQPQDNAGREQAERVWKEGLELLRARIGYASDPNLTGRCTVLSGTVDVASLKASKGDSRLIKTATGALMAADAPELLSVAEAYASGCNVTQDMKRARQVLHGFAMATKAVKPKGKRELAAWCKLAHWYRYGLGGPKDIQAAESWEQLVKTEILPQGCYPIPPVDPANPWKVL